MTNQQVKPRCNAFHANPASRRTYDRVMQKYVKIDGDRRLQKVPRDLDLKPYRDEHDWDLMRRMQQAIEGGTDPGVKRSRPTKPPSASSSAPARRA